MVVVVLVAIFLENKLNYSILLEDFFHVTYTLFIDASDALTGHERML
jgi:hypothetical protein